MVLDGLRAGSVRGQQPGCERRRGPRPSQQFPRRGPYGETRTRTGDTTIFSRVLYQLSYLAERADG